MKKTLLILTIIFTYQIGYAQGTLQFNKVIYEVYANTISDPANGVNYEWTGFTVPAGKVWKVTLIGGYSEVKDGETSPGYNYMGDSVAFLFRKVGNTYPTHIKNRMNVSDNINEYYFGEGTYNFIMIAVNISSLGPGYVTANGIEYNIIE